MSVAQIAIPPKLIPVFSGEADVRGAFGGRGSAKTRTFAKMTAVRAYMWAQAGRDGVVLCGRQFMNSLDDSSLAEIKAAIRDETWLNAYFDIGEKFIRTKNGRVRYVFSGLDQNIDSVKSKAKILLCWVDEAEPVSEEAWKTLIPTLREEDSELWVTWNPKRKGSATDLRFRKTSDPRTKVAEINWRDNPKFPEILNRARLKDFEERPDSYDHVWGGCYETQVEGAYFTAFLRKARDSGRICRLGEDPLLSLHVFVDIGGTGGRADAFSMWVCQFVGKEIRILDHYEAQGQPIGAHAGWLRDGGYVPGRAKIWLPHDGATHDRVFDVSYESAFRGIGYDVEVVPNQGRGAAKQRIEAARRVFSRIWFDAERTEGGRDALGCYHEKLDEVRGIGLGPEHDWSSHSADSFGLLCVVSETMGGAVDTGESWRDRLKKMKRRSAASA